MSFCISSYQCPYGCLSTWCANLYYQFQCSWQSDYRFSTCEWQTPASFHTIPFLPLVADINIVTEVAVLFSQSSKGIAIFLKPLLSKHQQVSHEHRLKSAHLNLLSKALCSKASPAHCQWPCNPASALLCLYPCCSSCSRGALPNNCPPSVWLPSGLVSFFLGPSRLWLLFISASWYIVIYLLIVSSQEAVDLWGNCRICIPEDLHVVNA